MNALKISRVVLTIAAALLTLVAIAYANNLLLDGGFEDGFHRQAGINGVVPDNWTAINEVGNPTYFDNTAERIEGTHSLYIESQDIETPPLPGKPFKLDVYQKVPVISGTTYALEGLMVTFCAGTAGSPNPPCPSSYYLGKSVGLDPFGGVDPAGASVEWSPEDRRDAREARWVHLAATAVARASSMTVFLRMNSPFQFHGALGFMDGFQLAPAPVVSMASHPSVQSSTDVHITWTGWMDPALRNDGDYRLFYDVQVRDVTTSTWTTVARDVEALTSWSFAGQVGHTYAYRVRAVAHQPQLPDCGTCAGVNHFFAGLYSDAATVGIGDNIPPASAVAPLPLLELSPAITVRWSGSDNVSAPSALRYDVQARDGVNGAWSDWLNNTALTSALFTGQPGHQYAFRSRAHDEANNVEATHAGADAGTTVVLATIGGDVRNMREQPQPFVSLSTSPFATAAFSDLNGQYTVYVTASATYMLNFTHAGFGALPPVANPVGVSSLSGVAVVLPPAVNLIANGQFEAGSLGGWSNGGVLAPALAPAAHSGNAAALLSTTTSGPDTTLQQTIYLPPGLNAPTLSYVYRASNGSTAPFKVSVNSSTLLSTTTPALLTNWQHRWLDLSPFSGQTITLTFALQPNGTPSSIALDEVEVGSADKISVSRTYLPLATR